MRGVEPRLASWTTLLAGLHPRRGRDRDDQPRDRLGRDRRRRRREGRDGLGHQHHLPPGRDRDRRRGARRGLPVADRLEARRAAAQRAARASRDAVVLRRRPGALAAVPPRLPRAGRARRQPGVHQRLQRDPADRRGGRVRRRRRSAWLLVRGRDFVASPTRHRPTAESTAAEPASRRSGANPSAPAARTGPVLHELRIENLLLIERAELRLGAGLNAITGETGAGKTMLAHSLDLLMGGKARPQIVRPGRRRGLGRGRLRAARGPARRSRAGRDRGAPARATPTRSCSGAGSRASGRTSAFVAGRSASARRPAGARRRACSPSTASTSTAS